MAFRVLWHNYEPGLTLPSDSVGTTTGGSTWQRYLFDKMLSLGWDIYWGADGRVPGTIPSTNPDAPNVDVAFFYWRWQMPQYPDRQAAFERQMELIRSCGRKDIPVIVFDADHMLPDRDIKKLWAVANTSVFSPSIAPRRYFKTLMYPNPFDLRKTSRIVEPGRPKRLVYIGNNYERYDQAVRYFGGTDLAMQTAFFGNWIEPVHNKSRQRPEEVKRDMPEVNFPGRLDHFAVVNTLSRYTWTMHLAKDSYCDEGFVTIRWAEAVAAGIPAFIPQNFNSGEIPILGRVSNKAEMKLLASHPDTATLVYSSQRAFVEKYMVADSWIDTFKQVASEGMKEDDEELMGD